MVLGHFKNKKLAALLFGILFLSSELTWAAGDPLGPQELVTRCFQSIANIRLSFNDSRRASVTNQLTALALCDKLIDAPQLNPTTGTITTSIPTIRISEAKDVIRRFQQFHESIFKNDKFEQSFNEFGFTKQFYDTGSSAAYFTLSVFGPTPDYGIAVSEPNALNVIRTGTAGSPLGNIVQNSSNKSLTNIMGSLVVGSDRGLFSGIQKVSDPANYSFQGGVPPSNDASASFSLYTQRPSTDSTWEVLWRKSLGGGFLGDPAFLMLNLGLSAERISNGSLVLPRRWSKEVMSAAFCRNGPYVKSSEMILTSDRSTMASAPSFRKSTNCLQCHSTMDPMAIGIKNISVKEFSENFPAPPAGFSTNNAQSTVFYGTLRRVKSNMLIGPSSALPDATLWPQPSDGVNDFYRSKVHGRLTFTSALNGSLYNQNFSTNYSGSSQLMELGNLIKGTQDYYLCGALRYFELFSGVHIDINSEDLPNLASSSTAYDQKIWNDLKTESIAFSGHHNPKTLMKNLIRTAQFQSRSWGRKGVSNAVKITSVNPASGIYTGGTSITISGSNFSSYATVSLGGVPCLVTNATSTEITCTTGSHLSGAVSVDVHVGTNLDTLPNGFNYLGNATYTSIRINILEPKCIGCHAASSPSAGYSLTSYSSVITRVVSGNGAGSTLYNRVNGGGMPPSGNPLNALEIKTIKDWIDLGAQNN